VNDADLVFYKNTTALLVCSTAAISAANSKRERFGVSKHHLTVGNVSLNRCAWWR